MNVLYETCMSVDMGRDFLTCQQTYHSIARNHEIRTAPNGCMIIFQCQNIQLRKRLFEIVYFNSSSDINRMYGNINRMYGDITWRYKNEIQTKTIKTYLIT